MFFLDYHSQLETPALTNAAILFRATSRSSNRATRSLHTCVGVGPSCQAVFCKVSRSGQWWRRWSAVLSVWPQPGFCFECFAIKSFPALDSHFLNALPSRLFQCLTHLAMMQEDEYGAKSNPHVKHFLQASTPHFSAIPDYTIISETDSIRACFWLV